MPFDFCLGVAKGDCCRYLEEMKSETWLLSPSASFLPNFVLTSTAFLHQALSSSWWPYSLAIGLSLIYDIVPFHCLSALGIVIAPCSYKSWILQHSLLIFFIIIYTLVRLIFPIYSIGTRLFFPGGSLTQFILFV